MIGLSASTAARKNCFTAASLYFCCVRSAISTSAVWRMARARCQFTVTSESTSGASTSTSRWRHLGSQPPIDPIGGRVVQRIVGRLPGVQFEMLEEPAQQLRVVAAGWNEADGMLRAGGQGRGGAGRFARQVVEDHRLADVRAADDGHDQQRRPLQLRQQLAMEEIEPFPALRRSHAHALRRGGQRFDRVASVGRCGRRTKRSGRPCYDPQWTNASST